MVSGILCVRCYLVWVFGWVCWRAFEVCVGLRIRRVSLGGEILPGMGGVEPEFWRKIGEGLGSFFDKVSPRSRIGRGAALM